MNNGIKEQSVGFIVSGIVVLVVGICFTMSSLFFFLFSDEIFGLFAIPFVIAGITVAARGVIMIRQGQNLKQSAEAPGTVDHVSLEEESQKLYKYVDIANKAYVVAFLLFWFGFLIFIDVHAFKQWNSGGEQMFFFSLLFWAFGIYAMIEKLIKKR